MHQKVQVVIIQNQSNLPEVLMLKTNKKRGGFWQNVTGSVEKGESFLEAAHRELWEETGLKASQMIPLNTEIRFIDRLGRNVIEKSFLALLEKKPENIQISDEHETYNWVKINMMDRGQYGHEGSFLAFKESIDNLKYDN